MKIQLATLFFLCVSFSCSYAPEDIIPSVDYILTEERDYIFLEPTNTVAGRPGLMFIPGGLVDPMAYVNNLRRFTTDGYPVLIIKPRGNLAIFNARQCIKQAKKHNNFDWILLGHSLGGVVASMAVNKEPELFKGLVLLASYSTVDIRNWSAPIMQLMGEHDEVLDWGEMQNNAGNLPDTMSFYKMFNPSRPTIGNTVYHVINGGNHAMFGDYGIQKGDGIAEEPLDFYERIIHHFIFQFFVQNNLK